MDEEIKKEGAGSSEATTTNLARTLVRDAEAEGLLIDHCKVQFITDGLYAVELLERGSNEPERYFVRYEPRARIPGDA